MNKNKNKAMLIAGMLLSGYIFSAEIKSAPLSKQILVTKHQSTKSIEQLTDLQQGLQQKPQQLQRNTDDKENQSDKIDIDEVTQINKNPIDFTNDVQNVFKEHPALALLTEGLNKDHLQNIESVADERVASTEQCINTLEEKYNANEQQLNLERYEYYAQKDQEQFEQNTKYIQEFKLKERRYREIQFNDKDIKYYEEQNCKNNKRIEQEIIKYEKEQIELKEKERLAIEQKQPILEEAAEQNHRYQEQQAEMSVVINNNRIKDNGVLNNWYR